MRLYALRDGPYHGRFRRSHRCASIVVVVVVRKTANAAPPQESSAIVRPLVSMINVYLIFILCTRLMRSLSVSQTGMTVLTHFFFVSSRNGKNKFLHIAMGIVTRMFVRFRESKMTRTKGRRPKDSFHSSRSSRPAIWNRFNVFPITRTVYCRSVRYLFCNLVRSTNRPSNVPNSRKP